MFREEAHIHGIPVYGEISRAIECLSAAAHFRPRKTRKAGSSRTTVQSDANLQALLSSSSQSIWDEYDSKRLLKKARIRVVSEKIVSTVPEAEKATGEMGFPVVLKGLLPGEVHKTEKNLIRLGISTAKGLEEAYRNIQKKVGGEGRILLQQQLGIEYELMTGFVRDEQFGPCVMFGLGGVLSELQADVVFALAPLERSEALELMNRIHGRRLLEGFRGMPPLDRNLMAEMLINLSHLGAANPQIEQIDINPVAVVGGTPIAVDATVILKKDVRS